MNLQSAAIGGHRLGQELGPLGASGANALFLERNAQVVLGRSPLLRQLFAAINAEKRLKFTFEPGPLCSSRARDERSERFLCGPRQAALCEHGLRNWIPTHDITHYILQHAVERSVTACLSLANKHVTPHLIRHTSGMHLLQAGVDITVIALWLGHESTQTTHGYIEADLALKEKALKKVAPAGQKTKRFQADDELLRFLTSL